ncbi:MAG: Cobyrinic acid A,C-diamide synthase [candidate division BRC1 bacterium ADurb.BinA364]|nr:MAG: Cobyrinic acid A,C-diamide synthase [candidate division BRC1 bacterium ADurb.BinA364]
MSRSVAQRPDPPSRLLVAGLRGGSGKTTVALGLAAALRARGAAPAAFKKGPDYIDAAWLALASGGPCRNLDTFIMSEADVARSVLRCAESGRMALIEGNRGLYLRIAAVILNQVSGARHERTVRESIERYCSAPILGAIPRLRDAPFHDRHLGLIPPQEDPRAAEALDWAARLAEAHLDIGGLLRIARQTDDGRLLDAAQQPPGPTRPVFIAARAARPRIAVLRDAAFQFYYPENLEALRALGAEVVECSALEDARLPEADALYIGGGFPETQAQRLADNASFRESVRQAALANLPIYAECGGLMYLGRSLLLRQGEFPMAGVLPFRFRISHKPQGHGYAALRVERENPFYPVGLELRGHEFHYSSIANAEALETARLACRVERGHGIDGRRDAVCQGGVFALYTHVHALGTPQWGTGIVSAAERHRAAASGERRAENGGKQAAMDAEE